MLTEPKTFAAVFFGWDMKKVKSMIHSNVELWMCEKQDEGGLVYLKKKANKILD